LVQCAGVGCGLVHVVAGEERARKVFILEGPPGDGETSRLGSRDLVDGGTRCGLHGGETSKTKSWTIEPVHGGDRVKRLGGRLLTVYFGAPSMFITLWFGFDYGTNPPLGTLII
jgi:hypothetical protein